MVSGSPALRRCGCCGASAWRDRVGVRTLRHRATLCALWGFSVPCAVCSWLWVCCDTLRASAWPVVRLRGCERESVRGYPRRTSGSVCRSCAAVGALDGSGCILSAWVTLCPSSASPAALAHPVPLCCVSGRLASALAVGGSASAPRMVNDRSLTPPSIPYCKILQVGLLALMPGEC